MGSLLPWDPLAQRPRGLHVVRMLASGEPRGYTPESKPGTRAVLCRKSHIIQLRMDGTPEQARDCIDKPHRPAASHLPCPQGPCPKTPRAERRGSPRGGRTATALFQTRHWSRPCSRISRGRSMPIKTMRLLRGSSLPQAGPRSLPMSWCTPWKITLRSVPCMCSTPL